MDEEEKVIFAKTDQLKALMDNFDVVDINQETIHDYKQELDRIKNLLVETVANIKSFCENL